MSFEKRGEVSKAKADFLFEVSWEVCNKVGGINTVISSKVTQSIKKYGDNYFMIGPYFHDKVKGVFEETAFPEHCRDACESLEELGIVVHYGKWLIEGNPTTLLIDFLPLFKKKDEIKKNLWDFAGIDSLNSEFEFDEPVIWSWATGIIIEKFSKIFPDKKIVATFHEWISGSAILYLKKNKVNVGTVFITHATVLGRSLANSGRDIYCHDEDEKCIIRALDFDKEAYNLHINCKHQLEKACANKSDVFATVSEITALEAKHILKKMPDLLVPNGLNLDNFPTIDESSIKHRTFRDRIYRFLLYYFYPYYHLNIDNTLIYFIASRYEVHDKGIDILIKALSKLNKKLKAKKSDLNIVTFFWVPSKIRGVKTEIIENKTLFQDVEDSLKDNSEQVLWKLLSTLISDNEITKEALFDQEFIEEIKRKVIKFKSDSKKPPLSTHDLSDPNDEILKLFKENNLNNEEDDRVKVILYPIYLTGADGLLGLTYYEAILGSHFGVFPSSYEPWGYTPLEAGALGVASVTSDLAGFGRYISKLKEYHSSGIFVLERMEKRDEDATKALTELLQYFSNLPKKVRIENKIEARGLANLADWDHLISNYIDAQNLALERVFKKK